jgi:hypothetical protein
VSPLITARVLAEESEMIRTQIGKAQLISNGRSAWDALCDATTVTARKMKYFTISVYGY